MALIYSGVPLMLPSDECAAWVRSNFTLRDVCQFEYLAAPLKRRTQQAWSPEWRTDRPVRPQTLYWPKDASRCAIGNFIISQDNLDAIRKTLTTYAAKTLEMSGYDGTGKLVDQIRPSLYMLAATPVDVISGANGLWLLTLVDERFFWWFKQSGSWDVTENTTTWANVFSSLSTELGSAITTDTIASAYLKPSGAFQHAATVRQPLPPVIDAACYNVGQRLIRTLGGNVQTQTPATALASLQANLSTATANSPRAGGEFGYLASAKPNDLNAMVPASVKVYCQKANSEVPAKAWHEETVTLASLGMSEFSGVTGHLGSKIFHDTIVADYAGGGSPANATEITDLAKQIARDYYQWITLVSDRKFNGIVQMTPEGQSDAIEWLYGVNEVSTRVIPGAYTDEAVQLQHCSATYKSIDRTWLMVEGTPAGTITDATNANPIVITSTSHGRTTGDSVSITGVLGNTAANGAWAITVLTADTFSIAAIGNGTYTSGGTWQLYGNTTGQKRTQRSFVQFRNNLVVTDDPDYDRTIVDGEGLAVTNDLTWSISTTLAAAITTTAQSTASVSDAGKFPSLNKFIVQIDSEQLLIGAGYGTNSWSSIIRGWNGTTPATHANGATVTLVQTELVPDVNKLIASMVFETYPGPTATDAVILNQTQLINIDTAKDMNGFTAGNRLEYNPATQAIDTKEAILGININDYP